MKNYRILIREFLIEELNKNGINDHGILLYYAPAVLVNAKAAFKNNPQEGLTLGVTYLADLFALSRSQLSADIKTGVYTIDCAALANKIKTPAELTRYNLELQAVGDNARVHLKAKI